MWGKIKLLVFTDNYVQPNRTKTTSGYLIIINKLKMTTTEIIQALPTLSIDERLTIATIALTSTLNETQTNVMTELQLEQQLKIAANLAIDDYKNDPELTIFTSLDGSDFLE
jgi:hypothetical protein